MSDSWEPARPVDTKACGARFPRVVCGLSGTDTTRMAGTAVRGLGAARPYPLPKAEGRAVIKTLTTTDPVTRTRRCSTCHAWKPFAAFSAHKGMPYDISYTCTDCNREHSRSYQREMRRLAALAIAAGLGDIAPHPAAPTSLRERLRARRDAEATGEEAAG